MDDGAPDRDTLDELADLADDLLRQAADVRRQWAELGETLGLEPAPAARATAAEPADDGGERAAAQFANADPARLVALDMMLSGRSREEVDEYLRTTFGDDVDPTILDEIFSEPAS